MKIHAIILLAAIVLVPCLTLSQEIEWQKTIGGDYRDVLHSIQQTSDGGYILGGSSYSNRSGDKSEDSRGQADYWIVKTDSVGNVSWDKTIGGNNMDLLYCVQETSDGGFILGGVSRSNISGEKSENSKGRQNYWIVKTDSIGSIQWQKTIGGDDYEYLYSIQETTDGGFILGGSSSSSSSGDKSENSQGGQDYWIVKTDAIGNIQWQKTYGGICTEYLFSIQQTYDGGFILGGESCSNLSGDKTEPSKGGMDYWIIKTDSVGNIEWQKDYGGFDEDGFSAIQQTKDGGYILGGSSNSSISGDKNENCKGTTRAKDYWIIKIDSIGIIQWQNTIGGDNHDALYSIQQCSDGGYILSGISVSDISGDKFENKKDSRYDGIDFWLVKTNEVGEIQWQNTIGGDDYDVLYIGSVKEVKDGGIILGGYSMSNISGDKLEPSKGDYDYWMIKVKNSYNLITGELFFDTNGDEIKNSGELALINHKVKVLNTDKIAFSRFDGSYSLFVSDSGSFSVSTAPINYFNPTPSVHSAYFEELFLIDSLNDFGFQSAGMFNDLCITITPLSNFRSGFQAFYMINYENVGSTTLNPIVIFHPDDEIVFDSANITPSLINLDSVVWIFGPLLPFQSGSILVSVNVKLGIPIGSVINSGVSIEPITGDVNPACNSAYWEVFTTGSNDPNDIIVDQDTLWSNQFPNPPYLEYIIRFQNTGNDTAFTVKVINPLDISKLDLNTLEIEATSHPVSVNWIPWACNLEFIFENILLPDSIVHESASHGFIRYRIQPRSNLFINDSISNFAAIYFDFNEPVLTNIVNTSVVMPTRVAMVPSAEKFSLSPNPADSHIKALFGSDFKNSRIDLALYDLMGRLVFKKSYTDKQNIDIDISGFNSGVYIVEVKSSLGEYRKKFIKK